MTENNITNLYMLVLIACAILVIMARKTLYRRRYKRQLKTKNWDKLRRYVLFRDGYRCTRCGEKGELHVHHNEYIYGRKAWEYSADSLTTLCKRCHKREHK